MLTNRVTELTGRVSRRGTATREAYVVVFPDDTAKWTYPSRYLRSARGSADGTFTIRGLPPDARNRAIAVDYLEVGEGGDPVFLAAFRERSAAFSLAEGETRTIDLTLIER